ncbi:putative motility protein YjfB-like [Alkalispirillum mobile]|uniref:Putative motility protein YjfB-like n=1 Tax=Alkalispirillum mobile TaxID=85925 RepID=A0A498C757_9GAMM|nr:YjfB family protein [Alkalispirillum mobile]RLK50907.1 putative motility protein YjfB-like [Alkalispirillum mobile]
MADVSSIASLATGLSQANLQQAVQTSVQKTAMDIQESSALQLIDATLEGGKPAPAAPSVPSEQVGSRLDVMA